MLPLTITWRIERSPRGRVSTLGLSPLSSPRPPFGVSTTKVRLSPTHVPQAQSQSHRRFSNATRLHARPCPFATPSSPVPLDIWMMFRPGIVREQIGKTQNRRRWSGNRVGVGCCSARWRHDLGAPRRRQSQRRKSEQAAHARSFQDVDAVRGGLVSVNACGHCAASRSRDTGDGT
jgi:hypothetical protein